MVIRKDQQPRRNLTWIDRLEVIDAALDDAIKDLLSLSHELTAPKKRTPKLIAKNPGDSANGKEKETDEG